MADLRVNFCGVELKNPITTASGTFGFGHEYGEFFDLSMLGGIGVKGLTPTERLGNPAPRIAETPQGILNCVGLQNPGIDRFIKEQIPFLRQYDTKIIANVSGNTVEEYEGMVEKISDADVDLIEMNISCPNVKCGGMAFGTQPKMVEEVVSAAKAKAKKPLIVKLSPNVTDIAEIARAAESAGADALSLINTLLGMRIDIEKRRPILSNVMGGLSGPAVFPVAVRMVYQVRRAVSVPILGMGGIRTGRDIVEMLLAGADAVAMGTVMFNDPTAPVKALRELEEWMDAHGVKTVSELSGAVEVGGSKKISLKIMTLNNSRQKINDCLGNPVEIGIAVMWRVVDTAKAVFDVDNYKEYLSLQCDSALRNIVRIYPYDVAPNVDTTGDGIADETLSAGKHQGSYQIGEFYKLIESLGK